MKIINNSIKFNYYLKEINVTYEMMCANPSSYSLNHDELKRLHIFSNLWKSMVNLLINLFLSKDYGLPEY